MYFIFFFLIIGTLIYTFILGALSVGVQPTDATEGSSQSYENTIRRPSRRYSTSVSETCITINDDDVDEVHPSKKKKHNKISPLEKYETNDTKKLSNTDLQRLVLLKQLRVLEMKEEKLKKQLNPDVSEQSTSNNNSTIVDSENGKTYIHL